MCVAEFFESDRASVIDQPPARMRAALSSARPMRTVRGSLRVALIVITVVSWWCTFGGLYRAFAPGPQRREALAEADALFERGLDAREAGNRLAAIRDWSEAVALYGAIDGGEMYQAGCSLHIGNVLADQGLHDEAIAKYEQAIKFYAMVQAAERDRAQCWRHIARAHEQAGRMVAASDALGEAGNLEASSARASISPATNECR